MNNIRILLPAVTSCLIAILLIAGCATLSSLATRQETLEERVKGYMQAQIDGRWNDVYSFFDAATREHLSPEAFINQPRQLSYKNFSIEDITVLPSGKEAVVKVTIDLFFMGYDFPGAPQKQEWVKEKGAWYVNFLPQPQEAPFNTAPEKKE